MSDEEKAMRRGYNLALERVRQYGEGLPVETQLSDEERYILAQCAEILELQGPGAHRPVAPWIELALELAGAGKLEGIPAEHCRTDADMIAYVRERAKASQQVEMDLDEASS